MILDGWGVAQTWGGNAIGLAETPTINLLKKQFPSTLIQASGEYVGVPYNEPGNSEVGHLNIGTGQTAGQGLSAINQIIADGSFGRNEILQKIFTDAVKNHQTVHLMGLISDGGIHSHISHLLATIELAKKYGVTDLALHAFSDGRDTPSTSGINYLDTIERKFKECGIGRVATLCGRYWAMDRDNHWDRVEKTYNALVLGKGDNFSSARTALLDSYSNGVTDEFINPTVIDKKGLIKDGDAVIFFNYRSDRARQIARALANKEFAEFARQKVCDIKMATYGSYHERLHAEVVFGNIQMSGQLVSVLAEHDLTHLHVAETEKYAHVTHFFNGGVETPFKGEERILIPSPKVATYDQAPQMSADKITKTLVDKLDQFDFTVVNFANTDMVGHTGKMDAAIKAAEYIDRCLGSICHKIISEKCIGIITADHGNADQMINPLTGLPDTEHTSNPVPFIMVNNEAKIREDGRLCDVAPTILDLMDLPKPSQMIGQTMLI